VVAPGLLVGLWITTLGVIFLLDQMGIIPAHISFQFVWPAILIVAGLAVIFSTHSGGRFWGAVLLAWGAISISNELGFLHIRIGTLWPVLMIAGGLWMLTSSSGRFGPGSWPRWTGPADDSARDGTQEPAAPDPTRHSFDDSSRSGSPGAPPQPPPPPGASFFGVSAPGGHDDDATFDQSVILSGFKRRITSQRFRRGRATAVLGGFHIDFTRADIDGNRAMLHIDTIFGGGEVRVPDTWRIVIEATAIAGAFVDETYPQPAGSAPAKQLVIRGAAIFGGVTIKN
jgi:LiaF transmembrane domain